MKRFLAVVTTCLMFAGGWQTVRAEDQAAGLSRLIPSGVNTVSVLRLDKILKSPQGKQEGWAAQLEEAMAAGIGDLPPWIDVLVSGSLTHPQIPEEAWAAGVLKRPDDVTLESIAQHYSTTVVNVAGRKVVETSRGSFLVDLPGNVLGFYRPAHRQQLAAWIRAVESQSTGQMSDYLKRAANSPDDLVLSINLEEMFSPEFVRQQLEKDTRFASHRELIAQLVPLISGLKGVTLKVDVDQVSQCEISIDFSSPVGPSGSIVKTLFLAILEDAGATVDEFVKTNISVVENSVHLRCQLSASSLHRLVSLIVPPRAPHEFEPAAEPQASAQPVSEKSRLEQTAENQARANRRYLTSLNRIIDDLYRSSQNSSNPRGLLTWHETFARRIDSLPSNNVDPELLEFGSRTAQRFRSLARSLRGEALQVDVRNQAITREITRVEPASAYASYWGGFGYRPGSVEVRSNLQEIREQQAKAVLAGATERNKIWDLVRDDQTKVNQKWPSSTRR